MTNDTIPIPKKEEEAIMINTSNNNNAEDMNNYYPPPSKINTNKTKHKREKLILTSDEIIGIKNALSQHFLFNDKTDIIM